jgi:glycosyltransferase involved in cell wall biosynthesis
VVQEANCGFVVKALSPDEHARAILQLLSEPDLARTLGESGKQAATSLYTWEAESQKLQSLYKRLANAE